MLTIMASEMLLLHPSNGQRLGPLRQPLKTAAMTSEDGAVVGAVAQADVAAKRGHGSRVLEVLSGAGQWALGIAENIGVALAAGAIGQSVGLPSWFANGRYPSRRLTSQVLDGAGGMETAAADAWRSLDLPGGVACSMSDGSSFDRALYQGRHPCHSGMISL